MSVPSALGGTWDSSLLRVQGWGRPPKGQTLCPLWMSPIQHWQLERGSVLDTHLRTPQGPACPCQTRGFRRRWCFRSPSARCPAPVELARGGRVRRQVRAAGRVVALELSLRFPSAFVLLQLRCFLSGSLASW